MPERAGGCRISGRRPLRHRRPALGYRTRGREAATIQMILSGIRTTPERPPRNAFVAGFGGLALAQRRGRGR
jgi:hypothetical protein